MYLPIKIEKITTDVNWIKPNLEHDKFFKWKNIDQVETLPDFGKEVFIKSENIGIHKTIFESEIIRRHIMIKWNAIEWSYV